MIDVLCLAANIYFEARGESLDGQLMVAETTVNRTLDDAFPDTICGVVFQPHQFSWTEKETYRVDDGKAFVVAVGIANEVIDNGCILCSGATYYHNLTTKPSWTKRLTRLGKYGNHIFYKE